MNMTLSKQLVAAAIAACTFGAAHADSTPYSVGPSGGILFNYFPPGTGNSVGESFVADSAYSAGQAFSFETKYAPVDINQEALVQAKVFEFDPTTGKTVGTALGSSNIITSTIYVDSIFTGNFNRAVAAGDTLEVLLSQPKNTVAAFVVLNVYQPYTSGLAYYYSSSSNGTYDTTGPQIPVPNHDRNIDPFLPDAVNIAGTFTVSAVPEPASVALLLVGLGSIGIAARRRVASKPATMQQAGR